MDEESMKKAVKEAVKEWLADEKKSAYENLGKKVLNTFLALFAAASAYFIIWANTGKHA